MKILRVKTIYQPNTCPQKPLKSEIPTKSRHAPNYDKKNPQISKIIKKPGNDKSSKRWRITTSQQLNRRAQPPNTVQKK